MRLCFPRDSGTQWRFKVFAPDGPGCQVLPPALFCHWLRSTPEATWTLLPNSCPTGGRDSTQMEHSSVCSRILQTHTGAVSIQAQDCVSPARLGAWRFWFGGHWVGPRNQHFGKHFTEQADYETLTDTIKFKILGGSYSSPALPSRPPDPPV